MRRGKLTFNLGDEKMPVPNAFACSLTWETIKRNRQQAALANLKANGTCLNSDGKEDLWVMNGVYYFVQPDGSIVERW